MQETLEYLVKEVAILKKDNKKLHKKIKDLKEELRVEKCRRMGVNPYEEKKPYDLSSVKKYRKK